jgi:type I restriction enzyme S subunit
LRIKTKELGYRFLYYSLVLQHRDISFDYTSKAHPSVIRKLYSIPSIPRPEQDRIAEILSALDEAIEQTDALIAKYQQIKAGLMHNLFTRGVTPDGHLRPTRAEAPPLYKESLLGWIPKDWCVIPLASFATTRPSGFVNGPFGSDLLTSELRDSGVPVIYVQDIKEDEYRRISIANVTEQKANELLVCNVRSGDVLVAKVGDPPGIAAPYFEDKRAVVTQDVIRIRPADDVVTSFLASLLNSTVGRRAIRRITIEGTRARVSLTEFKRLLLPKPAPGEQQLISERISAVQRLLSAFNIEVAKLKTTRHGLLHDLLTGRVRVRVPEQ